MTSSVTTTFAAPEPVYLSRHRDDEPASAAEKTSLQRLSHGVTLQGVPSFTSVELQRRWMLEHLAGAFRVFARKGYSEGLAGHISLRDPEHHDCFWTNPYGTHIGLMRVSDLILINESGEAVGGATHLPANAAGFQIHSHLHKRYAHINAACHMHSKYGKAYSAFGQRLEMINQDSLNFYGDAHGVYQEFGGVVLTEEEGEKLAQCLGEKGKGLILQNHGLLTVGQTVDEAAYLYTLMERSCEVQLLADAAAEGSGKPKIIIGDKAAQFTFEATSDPDALYCSFQPDFQMEMKLSDGDFLH
ncbi:aldolase [Purpureocillium lilacinum]|uniref:Aldolase n=1 Tax=Purpureocillium lilacinum TaxID=33203 RepID=A0A179GX99_PURLI|nr:aldolase [Purpureocillium lilacinum]OAQ82587.1 aldolase [Purpureocillium lilacinum]